MNKNLFNILETLSPDDWIKLGKFISSPYFVNKRDYREIYSFLKKYYKTGDKRKEITEEYIKKKLKGKKSPGTQTIHNRLSEFCRITENFLSHLNFERDRTGKIFHLMDELNSRQLIKNFKNKIKTEREHIFDDSFNADNFFRISQILLLESSYYQSAGNLNSAYRSFNRHSEYMFAYFLERLYYLAIDFQGLETLDVKFDFNIIPELINSLNADRFIKRIEKQNSPVHISFLINYYLYNAYLNPDEKKFINKVKNIYAFSKASLNNSFKTKFYLQLESYYVRLLNMGKTEFERDLFLVYKEKLEEGIYEDLLKIYYPSQNFRDYIIIGLRVGELEWVENFITTYAQMLPLQIREDERTLALARVYIYKSEFHKALKILSDHKSSKHVNIIDISRIKLKIYYELNMQEEIFFEIDNLKHFIRKTIVSKILIDNTKDFIDKLTDLMRIISGPERNRNFRLIVGKFISDIEKSSKPVPDNTWFLEKAKELIQK